METFHFNLLKEGKGNFVVCMDKAIEVSKTLFSQKKIIRMVLKAFVFIKNNLMI